MTVPEGLTDGFEVTANDALTKAGIRVKAKDGRLVFTKESLNTRTPEQRGCCANPDWRVGFLFDYCNNCGADSY